MTCVRPRRHSSSLISHRTSRESVELVSALTRAKTLVPHSQTDVLDSESSWYASKLAMSQSKRKASSKATRNSDMDD